MLNDLTYALGKTGLLNPNDQAGFVAIAPFLALYVVALMHGSAVLLEGGDRAELVAGFDNDQGRLEVKARLVYSDMGKPIYAPVCIFWTVLRGAEHCTQALLDDRSNWQTPLEIDGDRKLAPLQ